MAWRANRPAHAGIFRSPAVTHDGTHRAYVIASGGRRGDRRRDARRHRPTRDPDPGPGRDQLRRTGASLAFIGPATDGLTAGRATDRAAAGRRRRIGIRPDTPRRGRSSRSSGHRTAGRSRHCGCPGPDDDELASLVGTAPPTSNAAGGGCLRATTFGSPSSMSRAATSARPRTCASRSCSGSSSCRSSTSTRSAIASGRPTAPRSCCRWSTTDGVDGIVVVPADGSAQRGSPMARWDSGAREVVRRLPACNLTVLRHTVMLAVCLQPMRPATR